jgi:hypothetical protein
MRSTFLAAVLLVSFAGTAVADSCDDYAARAVAAAAEAKKLGCLGRTADDGWAQGPISIVGPRWSPNFEEHANWCRAHGNDTSPFRYDQGGSMASSEENQRDRGRLLCTFCNEAATEAVQQTQAAVDLKCGFTGPEWDNNSFATQMQACFAGKWYWQLFFSWPQMHYDNQDRANKLSVCKQEASVRSKLRSNSSRYSTKPSYTDRDRVTIPCKPGVRYISGPCAAPLPPQTPTATKSGISNPMDRLGDVNAGRGLSSVSGNAGGAQLGRPATPSATQTSKSGSDGLSQTNKTSDRASTTKVTPKSGTSSSGDNTVDYGSCATCGKNKPVQQPR